MNINSNEILLLNKKMMKLRNTESQSQQEPTTTTVTNPEQVIEGLETQGQNNLAFQGVNSKLLQNGAMKAIKPMLALALLGGMVSCSEDKPEIIQKEPIKVEQNVTVNVDLSAWAAFFQQMLENDKIQQDQMNALLAILQQNQADQAALKEALLNFMMNSNMMQEAILNQLIENGKTEKEALEVLNTVCELMSAGKFEEAFALLQELLGVVKDIRDIVKTISEQMATYHKEYMAAKEEEIELLGNIYFQGKIDQSYLEDLFQNTEAMKEYLADIKATNAELKNIFTDEEKYNKFINDIKNSTSTDIDYDKLEELFKMYGFANLDEVINTARKDIIEAINNFENTYITTEEGQTILFKEISSKLDFIADYLPQMDQSDLKEAIEKLINSVDNVDGNLEDINAKLDVIIAKFDIVIDNTSGLTEYFAEQNDNWHSALKELNKSNEVLEQIRLEQKLTNEKLDAFKTSFDELKAEQKISNSYLNILVNKADDIEEALKGIQSGNGGSGMTVEQFIEAMKDRDEARDTKLANDFEAFIKKYGFDKVPTSVQSIEDLLKDIKKQIAEQKDYSAQLDTIISYEAQILAFLKQADFSNPDYTAKLEEIINLLKEFECNCSCSGNSDNNEGIFDDLENLLQ